jgi:hypothetical protein
MNRERKAKLLKHTGLAVLKRPDGGVVTQRTANPMPLASLRDSSHNSPSVPRISFQGLSGLSANAAQADTHGNRRDVEQARPARVGSAVGNADAPETPSPSQRTHP